MKQFAPWFRFIFGVTLALGLGVDSYIHNRSVMFVFFLPAILGLLAIADIMGNMTDHANQSDSSSQLIEVHLLAMQKIKSAVQAGPESDSSDRWLVVSNGAT
jgi:hypothetical protein